MSLWRMRIAIIMIIIGFLLLALNCLMGERDDRVHESGLKAVAIMPYH